jgi:hypothetical protein
VVVVMLQINTYMKVVKSGRLVEIVFTNAYFASVIVAQLMWLYVCYGDSFNWHSWKEVVSVIFPKLLFYFFLAMHFKIL